MFSKKNDYKELLNSQYGKYGKVIEKEDKIIIYINQGKVYKYNNKTFDCVAVDDLKDVYYIFNNIFFGDETVIDGRGAKLIFRNCTFNYLFKVLNANYVEIENNKYTFYGFMDKNYVDLTALEIMIKNNDFTNTSLAKKIDKPVVDINLVADKINVDNSILCSEFDGNINIMANKLYLNKSVINGPSIYLMADDLVTTKTIFVASKKIEVDNKKCNFMSSIKSPIVIYNGIMLNSSDSKIVEMNKKKEELLNARIKLINELRLIKEKVLMINNNNLLEIQERLNNKKISKVLKK